MLEVTILKVLHSGRENADLLLPYIEKCDIFAPEAGGMPERTAKIDEWWWKGALKKDIDYHEFEARLTNELNSREDNEWGLRLHELLHQYQKPIYYVERFSSADANRIWSLIETAYHNSAERYLKAGRVKAFLNRIKEDERRLNRIADQRDQHIAGTIKNAELDIRKRYPSLREKELLRLVVFLGAFHAPERYVRTADSLVVIPKEEISEKEKETISYQLLRAYQARNTPEIDRLLLADGLNRLYSLPETLFLECSFDLLVAISEEQRRVKKS